MQADFHEKGGLKTDILQQFQAFWQKIKLLEQIIGIFFQNFTFLFEMSVFWMHLPPQL